MLKKGRKPEDDTGYTYDTVPEQTTPKPTPRVPPAETRTEYTTIGKNISIEGRIRGNENLVIDGSLKGNIQGLGKDIVAATLRAAGFHVVDLGVDVIPEDFVKIAVREKAQIIAVSISMEETTPYLKQIADILKKTKLQAINPAKKQR